MIRVGLKALLILLALFHCSVFQCQAGAKDEEQPKLTNCGSLPSRRVIIIPSRKSIDEKILRLLKTEMTRILGEKKFSKVSDDLNDLNRIAEFSIHQNENEILVYIKKAMEITLSHLLSLIDIGSLNRHTMLLQRLVANFGGQPELDAILANYISRNIADPEIRYNLFLDLEKSKHSPKHSSPSWELTHLKSSAHEVVQLEKLLESTNSSTVQNEAFTKAKAMKEPDQKHRILRKLAEKSINNEKLQLRIMRYTIRHSELYQLGIYLELAKVSQQNQLLQQALIFAADELEPREQTLILNRLAENPTLATNIRNMIYSKASSNSNGLEKLKIFVALSRHF